MNLLRLIIMAEKINLAEFNIDIEALTAAAAETVRAIEQIRKEQSAMRKEGKQTDEAFVRNAVTLRGLQKDYNAQIKVIENYMTSTGKQVPIQQRIDAALSKEAVTVKELRNQTSELIKIRNDVNLTTAEGEEQLNMLNAAIDRNNGLVKNNVSEMEQQKMSVGGYADAILDAFGTTNMFNGTLGDMQTALKSLTPVYESIKTELASVGESLKSVTAGTEGLSKTQAASVIATNAGVTAFKALRIALIATGIGAIVVVLGSLVAYLSSSEKAANRFSKMLGTATGVVRAIIRQLEPLGEILFNVIEKGFQAVGAAADATLKFISNGLKTLGFDNASESVANFRQEMGDAAQMAEMLADREAKYAESQRQANRIMLDYQRQAERLRQIRDDESLSIAEREKANEQLGKVLQEQLATEKQIATQALEIANIRIAADGDTAANLDAQAEAMERISDIQERVEGQMSEQLTNRNQLQRDAATQAKEAAAEAQRIAQERVAAMNEEIDLYIVQQGTRARTLEESLALEQSIADQRLDVLNYEYENKLISQANYEKQTLEMQQALADRQAEIAVNAAQQELRSLDNRLAIEAQISEAVGDERIKLELEQAQKLSEAKADFELARFEAGLINEQEYQNALDDIRRERLIAEDQAEREREQIYRERKKESADLMLEAELLGLEQRQAAIWEIEEFQINAQRERDLEAARQKYTDEALLAQAILNINQQAENAISELARVRMRERFEAKAEFLGAMASIFGEETAIGKAAGIAQATVNAYVGMTEALKLPWPLNLAAAASTLATGLSAVRSITSTKTDIKSPQKPSLRESSHPAEVGITINEIPPFATGGLVTGGVPIKRSNGDNVLATLKKGEVVLNESQQRALGGAALFRHIGVPGFASGGLVGANTATLQRTLTSGINEQIAESIGEAVRKGARTGTEVGAHRGIMDLSTERYLGSITSF